MPCSRDGEREGRRRRREGGQCAVSVSRPTRAFGVSRGRGSMADAGFGPAEKTNASGKPSRGRARTSRQSTNVMERSVVNEHSSCHMCERRMATGDGPLWSPRQPQWRPEKPKPKLLRVLTSARTVYGIVNVGLSGPPRDASRCLTVCSYDFRRFHFEPSLDPHFPHPLAARSVKEKARLSVPLLVTLRNRPNLYEGSLAFPQIPADLPKRVQKSLNPPRGTTQEFGLGQALISKRNSILCSDLPFRLANFLRV